MTFGEDDVMRQRDRERLLMRGRCGTQTMERDGVTTICGVRLPSVRALAANVYLCISRGTRSRYGSDVRDQGAGMGRMFARRRWLRRAAASVSVALAAGSGIGSHGASAETDTTPPALSSFSFAPDTIDPDGPTPCTDVTVRATDDVGVVQSVDTEIRFIAPSGFWRGNVLRFDLNGDLATSWCADRGDEAGIWTAQVSLGDGAGNVRVYTADDLRAAGYPTDLTVEPSVADTTPPTLTSFTFAPDAVDPGGTPCTAVTIGATDDVGVVRGFNTEVRFTAPSGFWRGQVPTTVDESGNLTTSWCAQLGDEPGVWTARVSLSDKAGNVSVYETSDLRAGGFPTDLTVQPSAADTTAPILTSFRFAPDAIDPQGGTPCTQVTVGATDDVGVVRGLDTNIRFTSPSGSWRSFILSSLDENGDLTTSWCADAADEQGVWTARVSVSDKAENITVYEPADLAALGFPTDLTVGEPAPVVLDTTIKAGPGEGELVKKKDVRFEFSSSMSGATFDCSIDGSAFTACTSPWADKLAKGSHTFRVRSVAGGVTDATPAERTFSVGKGS